MDNIKNEQMKSISDLRELLSAVSEEYKSVALQNAILIKHEFDHTPVHLSVNDKTMKRAFSNLISNALRYAKSEVTLTCKKTAGKIEVSVKDDGEGMSEEDMQHIFERFYKGKDGNHGIGLSIVKGVVEQHDGSIIVRSDCHGSKFTLLWRSTD